MHTIPSVVPYDAHMSTRSQHMVRNVDHGIARSWKANLLQVVGAGKYMHKPSTQKPKSRHTESKEQACTISYCTAVRHAHVCTRPQWTVRKEEQYGHTTPGGGLKPALI